MSRHSGHSPSVEELEAGCRRIVERAIVEGTLEPQSPYLGMTVAQYRAVPPQPLYPDRIFRLGPRQPLRGVLW